MASPEARTSGPAPTLVVTPRLVAVVVSAVGLLPILAINAWQLSAAVFFLALGWVSIVMTGLWLWRAGVAAASESSGTRDVGFEMATPRDELSQEKRSLLKAIKEIDFDRQMGKMSDEDCDRLTRMYRKRAIEVIKALESDAETSAEDGVDAMIERELRARRAVDKATKRGKKGKRKTKDSAQVDESEGRD